ncbi:IPT/TIG domain-containing protein [Streptomyces sp. NPDC050485]|uniref:IPT/TIG domain-containing protein n=1 Tax=Streptomyces sp. NPDC050485 TaxID=3365617 RepID=UPI0037AC360B
MIEKQFVGMTAKLEALTDAPAPRKGPPCSVGAFLAETDQETAATLRRILDTPTVPATAIATVLSQHGHAITAYTVARHRRRSEANGCRCTPGRPVVQTQDATVTRSSAHPSPINAPEEGLLMGLYWQDGTRITKAEVPAAALDDPPVRITQDIYISEPYGRGDGQPEGSKRFLLYPAGTIALRSVIDRLFAPATVTSISPANGPAAGDTTITIKGDNLDGISAITFGSTAGTELQIRSAGELTVKTPSGTAGPVTVTIVDDSGSVAKPNGFTYV